GLRAGRHVRDDPVLRAAAHRSSLDIRRSASGLPPVWHVGQYCIDRSANDTSCTVSPQGTPFHPGHGSPVRPCTRMPARLASLSSFAGLPDAAAIASVSTSPIAACSRAVSSAVNDPVSLYGLNRLTRRISSL